MTEFQLVGGSVITLFLMMAAGFTFGKMGLLSDITLSQMSKVLLCVSTPCIMVDTFLAEQCNQETVRGLLIAGAALVATYVLNMLLVPLTYRKAEPDDRGVLRFAAIYGNTGFMGFPLIQATLGTVGMRPAVVSLAVFTISAWTQGQYLIGGRKCLSAKKAVINPGVIGFILSMILFGFQIRVPGPVISAVSFLGSLNTPLAMVIIGGQMASVDFKLLFGDGRVYTISILKLIVVPVITMLVLLPFGLDEVTYMAVVILAACPVAGVTSLFSQMHGKNTSLAARLVTVTTIFCLITLPLMCGLAKMMCAWYV